MTESQLNEMQRQMDDLGCTAIRLANEIFQRNTYPCVFLKDLGNRRAFRRDLEMCSKKLLHLQVVLDEETAKFLY